jgi:hypothetical protein
LCAELSRVFPGSSPSPSLWSWLYSSPKLCSWVLEISWLVHQVDMERWSQKCSVQLRGTWWLWHLGCFPIRWWNCLMALVSLLGYTVH